jgi:cytochrome bd-type quinol oxidase subunit 2
MINKIKTLMFALSAMLVLAAPLAIPATALAVEPEQINRNICQGVRLEVDSQAGGASCEGTGTNTLNEKIAQIINILSAIIGVVAVFMIIYAGFRYITSGGSEKGIETAKKTIMYALIGLVIVALAQLIVRFVVKSASGV